MVIFTDIIFTKGGSIFENNKLSEIAESYTLFFYEIQKQVWKYLVFAPWRNIGKPTFSFTVGSAKYTFFVHRGTSNT